MSSDAMFLKVKALCKHPGLSGLTPVSLTVQELERCCKKSLCVLLIMVHLTNAWSKNLLLNFSILVLWTASNVRCKNCPMNHFHADRGAGVSVSGGVDMCQC